MTIQETISRILDGLDIINYTKMPDFANMEEPELYAVITLFDNIKARSDGKITSTEYHITIALIGFSEESVDVQKDNIISAMEEQRIFYSGTNYISDHDFPQQYRRDMEFITMYNVQ